MSHETMLDGTTM